MNRTLDPTPRRGAIAKCSRGLLGVITSETMVDTAYPDGSVGMAWTGIHLWDQENGPGKIGSDLWSSSNPVVIAHVDDFKPTTKKYIPGQRKPNGT